MEGITDAIGKLVSRFWEHGQFFLWGCAVACVLLFALVLGGWFLGFESAVAMFATYGLLLLIGAVVFTSLAAARSWESWPKRSLFFSADEEQCIWGHSRQTTGEVFTSFNIRMSVTNVSDASFHISKPRIVWPLRARWCEVVTAVLMTRHPEYPRENTYSRDFPILAHSRSHASGAIALKRVVCRPGKHLTFVVSVVDHRGRRHRIKFRRVRAANQSAV
jgi:hypothetical protein